MCIRDRQSPSHGCHRKPVVSRQVYARKSAAPVDEQSGLMPRWLPEFSIWPMLPIERTDYLDRSARLRQAPHCRRGAVRQDGLWPARQDRRGPPAPNPNDIVTQAVHPAEQRDEPQGLQRMIECRTWNSQISQLGA